jgi:hypothetical protein
VVAGVGLVPLIRRRQQFTELLLTPPTVTDPPAGAAG